MTERKQPADAVGSASALNRRDSDGRRTVDRIVDEMPRLRRYAHHLVSDADRADDLVNECLVRALTKLDSWQPGTNLRAWLFVILRNCLYDEHRRSKRRPTVHDEVPEDQLPTVSGGQEARVVLDEVDEAFARLCADHRAILHLVAIQGHRYADAADRLHIPVGTVRSRLSRAREALREALDPG